MTTQKILLVLFILAITFVSCEKNEDEVNDLLGDNGIPKAVNNFVPDEIIDEIKSLGMTINTGAKPPTILGTYLASPFILKGTNRSGDYAIGTTFADYYATFSQQDNTNLTISLSYTSSTETGTGIASFISGEGNKFTVFAKTNSSYNGSNADILQVISGTLSDDEITNFYYANFILDNHGDDSNWMANGEGRVLYDSDGSSGIIDNSKSISISNFLSPGRK